MTTRYHLANGVAPGAADRSGCGNGVVAARGTPTLVRVLGLALALVAALPVGGAAQEVAARLTGRVPEDVVRAVEDVARGAAARGLPVEPLIQKAIEGGAKGVAPDRVIGAVRVLAARLEEARGALRDGGLLAPTAEAMEGGAYALSAGLRATEVRDLARLSRPPYDPALTLRVAATLAALGVPEHDATRLVSRMITKGRALSELLNLPREAQAEMARGATPAEAAEGLARGAVHGPPTPPRRGVSGPPNP